MAELSSPPSSGAAPHSRTRSTPSRLTPRDLACITNDESEIRAPRALSLAPFQSHNRVCIQHRFVLMLMWL
eukprot:3947109-Prymnesium_polylepis.1